MVLTLLNMKGRKTLRFLKDNGDLASPRSLHMRWFSHHTMDHHSILCTVSELCMPDIYFAEQLHLWLSHLQWMKHANKLKNIALNISIFTVNPTSAHRHLTCNCPMCFDLILWSRWTSSLCTCGVSLGSELMLTKQESQAHHAAELQYSVQLQISLILSISDSALKRNLLSGRPYHLQRIIGTQLYYGWGVTQ